MLVHVLVEADRLCSAPDSEYPLVLPRFALEHRTLFRGHDASPGVTWKYRLSNRPHNQRRETLDLGWRSADIRSYMKKGAHTGGYFARQRSQSEGEAQPWTPSALSVSLSGRPVTRK